jgi:hypothetical protein
MIQEKKNRPEEWLPEEPKWTSEGRINAALSVLYSEPPGTWLSSDDIAKLAREKYQFDFPWSETVELNFKKYDKEKVNKALSKLKPRYEGDVYIEWVEFQMDNGTPKHYHRSLGEGKPPLDADKDIAEEIYGMLYRKPGRLDGLKLSRIAGSLELDPHEASKAILKLLCEGKVERHIQGGDGITYEYWVDMDEGESESDALGW